jgi:uncharacterized protein
LFRGILGILIGAGLYSEVYPFIQDNYLKLGDYGKLTFPSLLGVDPWYVIVPFAIVVIGVLLWMDRIDERKTK